MLAPTRLALVGSFLASLVPAFPVHAQSTGFLVRLGRDTIAMERITRTSTGMEGELLRRIPSAHVIRYSVTVGPDGLPREFTFTLVRPGGAPSSQPGAVRGGRIVFGPDSARVELERDSVEARMMPAAAGFPALPESYGLNELWLAELRRSGLDSINVSVVAPLGGPAGRVRARVYAADSVLVPFFGGGLRLRVGPDGALLGVDGRATTVKYEVDRIAPVNIQALADRFAAAETVRGAMGVWVSPRDTVTATVGGATLWVDYGRPAARGRDVFGHGVLGDTLWRTGANAATQFRTDTDLLIGGARVPAGTYTLWTYYDNGRATLIINTQTGQWGTQYDRARDLVRVPLRVGAVEGALVEWFTIAIRPTSGGTGGTLELRWDRTVLAVDLVAAG